jgi:hypothetical protein
VGGIGILKVNSPVPFGKKTESEELYFQTLRQTINTLSTAALQF